MNSEQLSGAPEFTLHKVVRPIEIEDNDRRCKTWYRRGVQPDTVLIKWMDFDTYRVTQIGLPMESIHYRKIDLSSTHPIELQSLTARQQSLVVTTLFNWRADALIRALIDQGYTAQILISALHLAEKQAQLTVNDSKLFKP